MSGPRYLAGLFWSVAAAFVVLATYAHASASLTLPVPWGDEAYFVWQARAFERWGTFIAPELDATRPILLLPFVYGAVLGTVFDTFEFSLTAARHVSFTFVVLGFLALALAFRRLAAPFAAVVLAGAFLLNGHFVTMANVARMESILFFIACAALLLVYRGYSGAALSLLLAGAMVHPNCFLIFLPMAAYVLLRRRDELRQSGIGTYLLLGIALVLWFGNGVYALMYWDGFVHDTALRVGETSNAHQGAQQFARLGLGLAAILAFAVASASRDAGAGPMMAIAAGLWMIARLRSEQWYEPFADMTYLLLSIAALQIIATLIPKAAGAHRWTSLAATSVVGFGLIALHLKVGSIAGPRSYLSDMSVFGMRMQLEEPYFTEADEREIERFLSGVKPGRRIVVEVYPWADGLLFARYDERIRMQVPYFDALFFASERWAWGYGPRIYATPDLYVIRKSRYHPSYLRAREERVVQRAFERSGVTKAELIRSRGDTEFWYAVRPLADDERDYPREEH